MEKAVSAADANRMFSKLLRGVRQGKRYLITSHGEAVARIVPIEQDDASLRLRRRALLKRLKSQPGTRVGKWERSELYQR